MKFRFDLKIKYIILLVYLLFSYSPLYSEISVIPDREYFATVHELITKAENSIEVEMYLAYSNNPQVKELLDEIIKAKERGVEVNILLENGQEENKKALEYLRDKGVVANFDEPETKLHAKLILVDDKKLIIGSSNWTKSAFSKNNESNVMVDLEEDKDKIEILRTDYADKLLKAIDRARMKIDIVIYSFQFEYGRETKNYEVMSALLRAYDRGVIVRAVLDSWKYGDSANEPAYQVLEQAGIEVYYDLNTIASHNKLVIIDNEIVLLGSANWTTTGLTKNREASILVRDPSTAMIYKFYIDELINNLPEKSETNVPIPIPFLHKGGLFREIYTKGGVTRLKLYTWFIWEAFQSGSFTLNRDYKKWYEAIYAEPALPWSIAKSDRISDLVQKFAKTGAIKREDRGRKVILVDLAENKDIWTDKDYIFVAPKFWSSGWVGKLSGRALYFYFINLAEFKKSPYKPVWINSRTKLRKEYGMKTHTLSSALKELMAWNLIEVKHDIPDTGQAFWERKANRYFIKPVWSEEELEKKWEKLIERHSQDLVNKARNLATRINEPHDPDVVASFILLMKIHGEQAVTKAVDRALSLSFSGGKWELRYIIGILNN